MTDFEIDMDTFSKVREALRPLDEGKGIDSSSPRDLWMKVNGVEYKVELTRSISPINMAPASPAKH